MSRRDGLLGTGGAPPASCTPCGARSPVIHMLQLRGRRAFPIKGWRCCPTASTRLGKESVRLQSVTLLGSSGSSCLSYKHSTLAVFPPSSNDASASKHCRICIECQRSTWCSEKTWLSSGNVRILCDSISGRGPPSFGYHRLATVPFTTLHCESACECLEKWKKKNPLCNSIAMAWEHFPRSRS